MQSRRTAGLLAGAALLVAGAVQSAPAQAAPLAPSALLNPVNDPAGAAPVDAPQFTWSAVAGAAAYELQLSDDDAFQDPQTVMVAVPRWTPTQTLAQDQYFWRVRALQADGTSSPWTAAGAFRREWLAASPVGDPDGTALPLAARPLLKLTDVDAGTAGIQADLPADQLTLSWTPVRGASYYVVDIATDPGFAPAPGSSARRTCHTAHTTFTPYGGAVYSGTKRAIFDPCNLADPAAPFLTTGGTYFVRVRAVDETPDGTVVTSLWSDAARPGPAASTATPASFTVVAPVRPTTDADLAAFPFGDPFPASPFADAPLLTWRPVTGAKAYLVGLAKDSSFNTSLLDADDLRTNAYWFTTNTELITNQTLLDNTATSGSFWFALPCSVYTVPGDPGNVCVGSAQAINTPLHFGAFTKRAIPVAGLSRVVDAANTVSFTWADQGLTSPDGGGMKDYELEVRDAAGSVVDDVKTDNAGYVPSKGTYPDGTYSWRVRVIDASDTPQRWTDGEAFATKAPVPPPVPAAAGTAPGAPGAPAGTAVLTTAGLKGTQAIAYGRSADIAGAVLTTTDAPVAGVGVEVQAMPAGTSQWIRVVKVKTSATGGFATVVTPRRNTRYRAVFDGTPAAVADTSPSIRVSVVPLISLKASAKRVALGETLTFTGVLRPKPTASAVVLQCRRGTRWVKAGSAKTSAGGYRIRVKVTSAKAGRCRVVTPASSRYAGGRSREAAFTVR